MVLSKNASLGNTDDHTKGLCLILTTTQLIKCNNLIQYTCKKIILSMYPN